MALVLKDRVKETTTSTGTGSVVLGGAVTGFQSFASALADGDTTYYTIEDGTDWETGLGTWTESTSTLARTTIFESSNSGSAVDFGAGTKNVFITIPATRTATTKVYATIDDLPMVNNQNGDQALVLSTNRLYLFTNSGWYNIALVNQTPTVTGNSASYNLAIDGTPTVVTLTGTDPEGVPLVWSHVATGLDNEATITNVDNVFTITPSTNAANAGTFSVTFRASDGVNIGTASSSFTLEFVSANWKYVVYSADHNVAGTTNNSYVDRSSNAHTITPNNTPYQTSFHPYLENWSIYLDGNGEYLTAGSGVSDFGENDFTVEWWIYFPTGSTNATQIFDARPNNANGDYLTLSMGVSLAGVYINANEIINNTGLSLSHNTWHHGAVCRASGTTTFYVNGVSVGSSGYFRNILEGVNRIGGNAFIGENTDAVYISNFRCVKGTAVYTGAFTPPTEKLTAISGTSLLTAASNRFVDKGPNNVAITLFNTPVISSYNPFGQESETLIGENKGSVVLEGSTSFLKFPVTSFTGDYTLECWVYKRDSDKAQVWGALYPTDGNFQWFIETNNKLDIYPTSMPSSGTIRLNEWVHLVYQRRSGTLEYFINGVKDAVTTANDTSSRNLSAVGGSGLGQLDGYIADARATIGSAVYTDNFTPPTSPVGGTSAYVYLPMDNPTVGNKAGIGYPNLYYGALDTSYTKYQASNINGALRHFGLIPARTSDFTIEGWLLRVGGLPYFSFANESDANAGAIRITTENNFGTMTIRARLYDNSGNDLSNSTYTANNIPQGEWAHFALVRESTTAKLYVNGVLSQTNTVGTTDFFPTGIQTAHLGNGNDYGISDIQILLGVAKYTADFTPPTAEQSRTYQVES